MVHLSQKVPDPEIKLAVVVAVAERSRVLLGVAHKELGEADVANNSADDLQTGAHSLVPKFPNLPLHLRHLAI